MRMKAWRRGWGPPRPDVQVSVSRLIACIVTMSENACILLLVSKSFANDRHRPSKTRTRSPDTAR
ncbi:hypothetical protein C2E23DRAFT_821858 [Lenzites betulinus]|nr:hypothetical protein C2E23DRAFT_821858 [Lenzites betulinus]